MLLKPHNTATSAIFLLAFGDAYAVDILKWGKSGELLKETAEMSLAQSSISGKGFQGNRICKVAGYEIHAFHKLWKHRGTGILAVYLRQMFVIKELPDNKQVAPQQKFAVFYLCLKLRKYFL